MTTEAFISTIKSVVHDSAVDGIVQQLEHPAGRRPPQRVVELSVWFSALPAPDRDRVKEVVEMAVHAGVFGLLAVLDGVRAVEDVPNKGTLEVVYRGGGERDLLTKPDGELLHDIYQGQVYEQVFGKLA
jgi:hypothetical protein